ncbi:tRNA (adenosine(37)-N6)-threonylcarbamoyltransferase complex ATPase subunit type 1 TsaE [Gilvimarinus sp. DA14]|uniref:tRNA (adenosine(37)-N6)-threonylcarbamoyltransferase complex ATPase subunit type 1 TsaE n=1 Tax=Gilvimarinus sp. DA14 TaxID=2956798 RepID=UPI0020B7BD5E|nr:tRNA (adenosine(37)-N6)-threonylcarbamoyltransferase complex ATPase subunit type 1 TsaE [Gilvimarinus sp. DA14]UTF61621.1 tRNA (adenosine(37)-N6)-threonylcarbamoyltransferase complex ATPase subunit type 1 TsaE [Gilvimarinus sp. DA14]
MTEWSEFLPDEAATVAAGELIGGAMAQVKGLITVHLQGDLGAGKTTLTRGVLRHFGHSGAVKSPTYTLVEVYQLPERDLYHFDLYRLGEPEELEYMGIRDYFATDSISLIEWPSRGEGVLPAPDVIATLKVQDGGRIVKLEASSDRGAALIARLPEHP